MIETQIDIQTPDGDMTTFEYHPEEGGPYPVVFYLMDAPSIRPALKDMASRLASAGYYVLMPFLYYRDSFYKEFGTSDTEMHERRELMQGVTRDRMMVDAKALLSHAKNNSMADPSGKFGAVGFCMSGPLVLGLAQRMPEQVAAIASIHGAWVVTDKDDSPHLDIDQIKAEVYFAWADEDPTATAEEREIMDAAMAAENLNYRIDFMPGALHGFAPPGGERYNREASERHWECVHALFKRNL
ncbi:MAG TPA: hydrolase [Gammaproteobacteria bacterium]|nr:hydrolase [Gammaproteobacteria bacterium]